MFRYELLFLKWEPNFLTENHLVNDFLDNVDVSKSKF